MVIWYLFYFGVWGEVLRFCEYMIGIKGVVLVLFMCFDED